MSETDQDEDYEYDELLAVRTGIQADEYVRKAFKYAGIPARDALFERFTARIRTHMSSRLVPAVAAAVAVQAGGSLTKAQYDKFYDFFQYVDSLHDFAPYVDTAYIAKSLGAELPEILKAGEWHRLTVEEVHGPGSTFFEDITAASKVRFAGMDEFDNPLYGRNFESGMLRYDGHPDVQSRADEVSPPCDGCSNVEIWSYTEDSMKILKLEQIVDAVCRIHETFGKNATFVVDESMPLTRLLLSMDLIYKSFLSSYRIEMTSQEDTLDIAEAWMAWVEMTTTWKAVTCDSGLMDAEAHDFPLHDAPTGRVFRDGSLVQIEMLSSSVTKTGKKVKKTYEYKLSSDKLPVWKDSKEKVIEVTNDKVGPNREFYSINAQVGTMKQLMEDSRNIAVPLAQKRAGDWGQVEHCRKYGMVLVTADKITALYAMYRNVRVMYVNTWRAAQDIYGEYGRMGDIFRWSFALCLVPEKKKQAGGGRSKWLQPVLFAVTVAFAAMASLRT